MTDRPEFTISIYQDPAHIEGLLQQMHGGLLMESSDSAESKDLDAGGSGLKGGGEVKAELKFPSVGGVGASANLSSTSDKKSESSTGQSFTRNFRYASAYYLHHVRSSLVDAGLLKTVETAREVDELSVGDFVEFRADFRPDEIIALLDVLNPELVAAITRWGRRKQIIKEISRATNPKEREKATARYAVVPEADSELARAIADAIRVDFRSAATREYFGDIGGASERTAIVVCDNRNFLVEDPDRILDGQYKVLGKVTTQPMEDVPILQRNKLLDRIKPAAVDRGTQALRDLAGQQLESRDPTSQGERMDDYVDLQFPSRVEGISFKVLPIAIYI